MKTLRLVLGDQLNYTHSLVYTLDTDTTWLILETKDETGYVDHHIQKVIGFFAAMYNYARFLEKKGHQVIHIKINDSQNKGSLIDNLSHLIQELKIEKFEYFLPDEFRLDERLKQYSNTLSIPVQVWDTEHFLAERDTLGQFFEGKKEYLMESFYRMMRKRYGILMEGSGKPLGGKWNYDAENRKKWDAKKKTIPPLLFTHNFTDIALEIEKAQIKTIGSVNAAAFNWPVSRKESLELLHYFVNYLLPHFGTYQDAMSINEWSLFHSRLSFSLNTKMIHPLEVVRAALAAFEKWPEKISLSQIEGFVRQIIGWREYMRGVYWARMPEFARLNYFNHQRKLPVWFWNADTQMRCQQQAIEQSLTHAYAHHIQRLMVTGNFALLAQVNPDELDEWYLGIYMDAIEWVEITNTRGMSQFADGGIVGTKPYCGSANYINKMSNYCSNCAYEKDKRHGEKACPLNSLYWNFYLNNEDKLRSNPRIGMVYMQLDKMSPAEKTAIKEQAASYLEKIDQL